MVFLRALGSGPVVHPGLTAIHAALRCPHVTTKGYRMSADGIRSRRVSETPFAVIDFETTGLRPGADRIVEVSIGNDQRGREPLI